MFYSIVILLGIGLLLLGIKNLLSPFLTTAHGVNGVVAGTLLILGGNSQSPMVLAVVFALAILFVYVFNRPPTLEVALARNFIKLALLNEGAAGPQLRLRSELDKLPSPSRAKLEASFAKLAIAVSIIEDMATRVGSEMFLLYRDCLVEQFVVEYQKKWEMEGLNVGNLVAERLKIYGGCGDEGPYLPQTLNQGRVLCALSREPGLSEKSLSGIEMPRSIQELKNTYSDLPWEIVMEEGKSISIGLAEWRSWASTLVLLDLEFLSKVIGGTPNGVNAPKA